MDGPHHIHLTTLAHTITTLPHWHILLPPCYNYYKPIASTLRLKVTETETEISTLNANLSNRIDAESSQKCLSFLFRLCVCIFSLSLHLCVCMFLPSLFVCVHNVHCVNCTHTPKWREIVHCVH